MGRGKLSLKLMRNEKARVATLRKRMIGLKKKAYEFSVLCDVKVCMIVFEPKTKICPAEVDVWPPNHFEVKSIIDIYRSKAAMGMQNKNFGICDYFNLRKRQIHDELAQVRKANFKAKFPTWDDRINDLFPGEIASFITKLDLNLEVMKKKLMMMKRDEELQLMESSKSIANPSVSAMPAIAKHLNIVPSLSPADDSLVKLSLSLDHMENSVNPIDESLRMSMLKGLDYGFLSGIASSSSSVPTNVMYDPALPSASTLHDLRISMPNNNVILYPPLVPVLHHDPSPAMQNNVDPRAFQTCFYVPPPMQPDQAAYFNRQPLMIPPTFHQMHPSLLTDFGHEINPYDMENNNQERF